MKFFSYVSYINSSDKGYKSMFCSILFKIENKGFCSPLEVVIEVAFDWFSVYFKISGKVKLLVQLTLLFISISEIKIKIRIHLIYRKRFQFLMFLLVTYYIDIKGIARAFLVLTAACNILVVGGKHFLSVLQ